MLNFLKPGFSFVPNMEQRVFLGTGVFVGIVLLVGWIALNEPGRMQVFTQTYHARSVENGADIFMNNCATCHGTDAKGITGRAPALDNPMLFLSENPGKVAQSKLDDLTTQQQQLQTIVDDLKKLPDDQKKYDALTDDQKKAADGLALKKEIDDFKSATKGYQLDDVTKQLDDVNTKIQDAQTTLKKYTDQGWETNRDVRLKEVAWNGSLHDYIYSTVSSGRPVSATYWPGAMPAWAQSAGGQLRPDQVEDVTQYVLNFQDQAVTLVPSQVNQQFKNPALLAAKPAGDKPVGASFDYKKFAADFVGGKATDSAGKPITADPAHGQALYTGSLGCAGCHGGTAPVCPPVAGTYTRVVNVRMNLDQPKWASPEEYIIESILKPSAYVVPGYNNGVMPQTFATQLTRQDLIDITAYLQTQK